MEAMKNKKRIFFLSVIGVFVVAAVAYCFVFRRSAVQTYTNQDYGFRIDWLEGQFVVETVSDAEVTELSFRDKNIRSNYPEWTGTVFSILVYDKNVVKETPFQVLDGPRYLGENDRFYYGIYFPTDVNYPPDDLEAVDHYQKLSKIGRAHV